MVSNQKHELKYEADKKGTSEDAVMNAKKSAGRSRKAVERINK